MGASTLHSSPSPPAAHGVRAAFDVLERLVAEGYVPGASAAAGTAAGTLQRGQFGAAELVPQQRPLREDALFDLASVTKTVTATLALILVERGRLHLDQRVASILRPFGALGKGQVTVRHLLTHTSGLRSGLPEWKDLHAHGEERRPVFQSICRQPLAQPPGTAVVYSDIGYFTLGEVIAAAGGEALDVLARHELFEPLGMAEAQFCPAAALHDRCVATEAVASRGGTIVGRVHDRTAAAHGGVAGHAGLFATRRDLERFCRFWLGMGQLEGRRVLSPATVAAATRDQTGLCGPHPHRGFGWVLQPNPQWPSADLCSPSAYGHTGFTGTSLVIDPQVGRFAVLLTNRVHPSRENGSLERVAAVRARFHNAVWAADLGQESSTGGIGASATR